MQIKGCRYIERATHQCGGDRSASRRHIAFGEHERATARRIEITPLPMNASTPPTSVARATLSTRVERPSFDDNGSPLELKCGRNPIPSSVIARGVHRPAQIDAVCILHPECAPALVSSSPPAAELTVNTLEISQAAQVGDASCGVKTRYSNPADPQSSEPEAVSGAAVIESATAEHSAPDKSDLDLMYRYGCRGAGWRTRLRCSRRRHSNANAEQECCNAQRAAKMEDRHLHVC